MPGLPLTLSEGDMKYLRHLWSWVFDDESSWEQDMSTIIVLLLALALAWIA